MMSNEEILIYKKILVDHDLLISKLMHKMQNCAVQENFSNNEQSFGHSISSL